MIDSMQKVKELEREAAVLPAPTPMEQRLIEALRYLLDRLAGDKHA